MKSKIFILLLILSVSFDGYCDHVILYAKSGRGLFGYKVVKNYAGESVNGNMCYLTTCYGAGLIRCKSDQGSSFNPNGSLDDIAMFYGLEYLNNMNDEVDSKIAEGLQTGSEFKKNQVTNGAGRTFWISIDYSWKPSGEGSEGRGVLSAVEIF